MAPKITITPPFSATRLDEVARKQRLKPGDEVRLEFLHDGKPASSLLRKGEGGSWEIPQTTKKEQGT